MRSYVALTQHDGDIFQREVTAQAHHQPSFRRVSFIRSAHLRGRVIYECGCGGFGCGPARFHFGETAARIFVAFSTKATQRFTTVCVCVLAACGNWCDFPHLILYIIQLYWPIYFLQKSNTVLAFMSSSTSRCENIYISCCASALLQTLSN